ncbi:MAG: hypothetical protein HYY48_04320 [Gammaproteobacteria bacterium]|nr:hypothetical protein [Gammaproteobacteria bacterium]
MNLHRLGVKFFAGDGATIALPEFLPVFHRWIQQSVLDELLLDVADYSHVHAGPGVLLVAHEGNYSVDETGNRRGLAYYAKHPQSGDVAAMLLAICAKTLRACHLLEREPTFAGKVKFSGDQLQIFANDRLNAPNTEATATALRPAIDGLLAKLYPGGKCEVVRVPDAKERFTVNVKAPADVPVGELLKRIRGE